MNILRSILMVSVTLMASIPEISFGQSLPMPQPFMQETQDAVVGPFGNEEPAPQPTLGELPKFDGVPNPITLVLPTIEGVSGAMTIDANDPCSCAKLPDTKLCVTRGPISHCGWAGDDGLSSLEDYVTHAECRLKSRATASICGFLERVNGCSGYPAVSSEGPECRKEVSYFPNGSVDSVRCGGNRFSLGCVEVEDASLRECEPYLQRPPESPQAKPSVFVGSECHWPMSQDQVQFLLGSNGRNGFNPREYLTAYCAERMCRYCSGSYENRMSNSQTFGPSFDGISGLDYKSCEPKILNEEKILRQPREEMIQPPAWSPIPYR